MPPSFDFPDSPVVGEEYSPADATFVWSGKVWNVKKPVEKEGIEDVPASPAGEVYGRSVGRWVPLDTTDISLRIPGVGLDSTGPIVNLQPANRVSSQTGLGEIGGVMVVGRSPLNGLEYDLGTGTLWSPPGTDILAGSIVEPPDDAVGYVRVRDAGVSNWVPVLDIAYGVSVGATAPPTPRLGDLWWRSDPDGDLMIWYDDGSSQQWVAAAKPTGLMDSPHDGIVYGRQDGLWTPVTGAISGDVPPATAVPNQLWYESDTGFLFINYDDGTSTQWVQIADSIPEGFLPLVGGTLTGPLHLPGVVPTVATEAVHKAYVDYAITAQSLYQGPWDVALNMPDLDPAVMNPLHNYSWVAQTADKNVPEQAPAQLPGIGGQMVGAGDSIIWNNNTQIYDLIQAPASLAAFVPIAGGTMTGKLNIDLGIDHAIDIRSTAGVRTMSLSASSADHSGLVEFWNPDGLTRRGYIGYGNATTLSLRAEGGSVWSVQGGFSMEEGAGIRWGSTSAQTDPLLMNEGICLYGWGTTSKFGFSITSGTLNYVVENTGNRHCFRVGSAEKVVIDTNGIGPRTSYNVTFEPTFSGTMDFRVNPSMVTMRINNVKSTAAQVGSVQHVKICNYPAGVPAPWGNLYVHVEGCSDTAYTFLGRHAMVSCQPGGVFLSMYGGSTNEDFPADTYFSCTVTWSR